MQDTFINQANNFNNRTCSTTKPFQQPNVFNAFCHSWKHITPSLLCWTFPTQILSHDCLKMLEITYFFVRSYVWNFVCFCVFVCMFSVRLFIFFICEGAVSVNITISTFMTWYWKGSLIIRSNGISDCGNVIKQSFNQKHLILYNRFGRYDVLWCNHGIETKEINVVYWIKLINIWVNRPDLRYS